jgi:hypothetical protein
MAADGAVAARAGSPATRGGRKTGQSLKVAHWTGRVWHHPMSALGSKADMCSAKRHVRFTPNSGHVQCNWGCPLSANSGHGCEGV